MVKFGNAPAQDPLAMAFLEESRVPKLQDGLLMLALEDDGGRFKQYVQVQSSSCLIATEQSVQFCLLNAEHISLHIQEYRWMSKHSYARTVHVECSSYKT